jgi:hypothetical protein
MDRARGGGWLVRVSWSWTSPCIGMETLMCLNTDVTLIVVSILSSNELVVQLVGILEHWSTSPQRTSKDLPPTIENNAATTRRSNS